MLHIKPSFGCGICNSNQAPTDPNNSWRFYQWKKYIISSTQLTELEKCWIDVPTVGSFLTSPEKLYLLETKNPQQLVWRCEQSRTFNNPYSFDGFIHCWFFFFQVTKPVDVNFGCQIARRNLVVEPLCSPGSSRNLLFWREKHRWNPFFPMFAAQSADWYSLVSPSFLLRRPYLEMQVQWTKWKLYSRGPHPNKHVCSRACRGLPSQQTWGFKPGLFTKKTIAIHLLSLSTHVQQVQRSLL